MYWISEPFLYLAYALLAGITILSLVPSTWRPALRYPVWIGPAAAIVVMVAAFVPIWDIVMFFKDDVGLSQALNAVLFHYKEGENYAWIAVLSLLWAVLSVLHYRRPQSWLKWMMVLPLAGIPAAMSSFNHAASVYGMKGQLAFYGHFTGMAVWTGILFITGWFSRSGGDWRRFLKWYHPAAVFCFLLVILSGLYLMSGVAPDLTGSWTRSYGQALLVKHVLIVPLLLFAFVNGFLIKRRLDVNPSWNPAKWAGTESVLILLIFTITGYMNRQPSPHVYTDLPAPAEAANTFLWLHPGYSGEAPHFHWNIPGMLLILLGLLLLAGIVSIFKKGRHPYMALLLAISGAVSLFCGIMILFS